VGLVIVGANRPDLKLVKDTIESIVVKRPRPTKKRPQGMCLDKGYDYAEVRDPLQEFGFTAHIRIGIKLSGKCQCGLKKIDLRPQAVA